MKAGDYLQISTTIHHKTSDLALKEGGLETLRTTTTGSLSPGVADLGLTTFRVRPESARQCDLCEAHQTKETHSPLSLDVYP